MKKLIGLCTLLILAFALTAIAGTLGGNSPNIGGVVVPLTVPKVAKASCQTITAGRATQVTLDVRNTKIVNWKAFSATDGAAVTVKRFLATGNTAYMPATGETNLPVDSAASALAFSRYSGNTTITLCSDRN